MSYQPVKGTKDYYPTDKGIMNWIAVAFRKNAIRYGFLEIESPALESLSLLYEKEGEEIKEQIFTLEKRSNEQLGLRFDITVPVARMFIAKQKELPKPVKWFYITRMWRYERPQKGRSREFYQFGVELIGSESIEADAQCISLVIDCFKELGLTEKDFVLKLNSRDLLQGMLEELKIEKITEVMTIIDKIAKIPETEFIQQLETLGLKQDTIKKLDAMLKQKDISKIKVNGKKAKDGLEKLKRLMALLDDKKKFIEFAPSIVRGLAYYNGIVYEAFDREGKYRALCGGGRYDDMIKQFGGSPEPACGFGVGFETITLLLDEKEKLPDADIGVDYYIVTVNDAAKEYANKVASELRKNYRVDVDLMGRNINKQLDFASKTGAKKVVIIGEDEIKSGKLTVKDMVTGKEKKVKVGEI